MATAAEQGAWFPPLITLGIAAILAVWAAYAFSAAGIGVRLPLTRTALVLISGVLVLRAAAFFVRSRWRLDLSFNFMLWSSVTVLVLAAFFAIGTWKAWPYLSRAAG
jgi:hypothetical protein